ncbi:MAG: T9SS type A sorting domain-containing protein [Saprospiraceae bacterium]|nr:T9SS type A sorting domain-containing protein [Saprospiraceae bacterium]
MTTTFLSRYNTFFVFFFILFLFSCKNENQTDYPAATEIAGEEDGNNRLKREAWFELMHQTAPGDDWRKMEYQNQMSIHHENAARKGLLQNRSGFVELAGGKLVGEWRERGSQNQAGSVFDTWYDQDSDEIWVISAGGSLFKGPRSGNEWEVVMEDLQLNPGILQFVDKDQGRRLFAFAGRVPHYSDDEGVTWQSSNGVLIKNQQWANFKTPVLLNDSLHTFYLISKPDYWDNARIYKSTDLGENFTSIHTIPTHEMDRFALCKPHHSEEVFYIEKGNAETVFFKIDPETDDLIELSRNTQFNFGEARANLAGIKMDSVYRWVVYGEEDEVNYSYVSEDFGATWTRKGELEDRPWNVGIYMSPTNPNFLLAGAVHCMYSINGGETWQRRNDWWAYYNNVEGALHADMMTFSEFETTDGEVFSLISNHGGLNVTYDRLQRIQNLGLTSLNVSQYYSVRTDPKDPFYIYAGSQDQGFQIANSFGQDEGVDFDQVISGDYGHTVFSKNGNHLWTVYPGGSVSFYAVPSTGNRTTGWDVDSENESVWIPPLMESPDQSKNVVYMAGGNVDGGPGSYMIQLEFFAGNINASQLPFNFKDESAGGELSAMTFSKVNLNRWYAATTNGRFFVSDDSGQNWEQTVNFIPGGHYLYGQTIVASQRDSNLVFLGGSGYSNPAVFRSTDGGQTFQPLDNGLPATLVFEMVMGPDERFLYAGTEAGPYVYSFEDEEWFAMAEGIAPIQSYWSVEYVPFLNIIRFGTYGRGIWDFEIKDLVSTENPDGLVNDINVFPNPSSGIFHVNVSQGVEIKKMIIFDQLGKKILEPNPGDALINLSGRNSGLYYLFLETNAGNQVKKLVLKE